MNRRHFLKSGLTSALAAPLFGAISSEDFDQASALLAQFVDSGQVNCAAINVIQGAQSYQRIHGGSRSIDSMFLLGSISKPICISALMTLFDSSDFKLEDPLKRFIPQFSGDGRDSVTMRHLLTHVSGLPDQLADNDRLRKRHATLDEFVEHAIRTPLEFAPGTRYQYSSMGVLLATHVAEIISQTDIRDFVAKRVFQPLGMDRSAQGMGSFANSDWVPVQMEFAAPEAGAGDPSAKGWDWNSDYWRRLGAPWGGTQSSVLDVGRYMQEFLLARGTILKPESQRMMVTRQSSPGLTPRGLGFNVGIVAASRGCSDQSFGHTGSTGTLAWADPTSNTVCVVLTSLPGRAVTPHPREVVGEAVAKVAGR